MSQINVALGEDGFIRPREERLELQRMLDKERYLLYELIKSGNSTQGDR